MAPVTRGCRKTSIAHSVGGGQQKIVR